MGIILNRRRVCGGKKDDTYIQDGLVFWLDGIDKGNEPTAWTDLVNGVSFPYNSGQEIRSDSIYFNGSEGLTSSSPSVSHPFENCQIEIVASRPSAGLVFTPNINGSIAFCFYTGFRTTCVSGGWCAYECVTPSKKTSYSLNNSYFIFDDVSGIVNYNAVLSIGRAGYYEIGELNGRTKYTGDICCIRIYNRHLTDEERIHNNNIDKQRFNL